jgi:hypothetical protein
VITLGRRPVSNINSYNARPFSKQRCTSGSRRSIKRSVHSAYAVSSIRRIREETCGSGAGLGCGSFYLD